MQCDCSNRNNPWCTRIPYLCKKKTKKKQTNAQALVFKCTEDKNNMTPQKKKKKRLYQYAHVLWTRTFFRKYSSFPSYGLPFTILKGSNQNIKVFTHAHSSRMTLFKLSPSVLRAFITDTICGIFKNSPPAIIVILKMLQNICNPYDRVILISTLINCGLKNTCKQLLKTWIYY